MFSNFIKLSSKTFAALAVAVALLAGGTTGANAQEYIPLELDGSPNGYQVVNVDKVGDNLWKFNIKIVRAEKGGKPLSGKTCTVKVSIGRVGGVSDRKVTLNVRGSGTVGGKKYISNVDPETTDISVGVVCK